MDEPTRMNGMTRRKFLKVGAATSAAAAAVEELRQAQGLLMAARGSKEEEDRPTEGGARTILAWLADLH